jgi:hypothetical protein
MTDSGTANRAIPCPPEPLLRELDTAKGPWGAALGQISHELQAAVTRKPATHDVAADDTFAKP